MRDAADRRKDLEREHADTLAQLRDKQAEVSFDQLRIKNYNFNFFACRYKDNILWGKWPPSQRQALPKKDMRLLRHFRWDHNLLLPRYFFLSKIAIFCPHSKNCLLSGRDKYWPCDVENPFGCTRKFSRSIFFRGKWIIKFKKFTCLATFL